MSDERSSHTELRLTFHGLTAVHAARAVHAALGGVPCVRTATVSLAGADVEIDGRYEPTQFAELVTAALEPIGVALHTVTVVQQRMLPVV